MKLREIQTGDVLILKGKSRHGKNRIQQHGNEWTVEKKVVKGHTGNIMLRSKEKTFKDSPTKWSHDTRWIWAVDDSDFQIIQVIKQ